MSSIDGLSGPKPITTPDLARVTTLDQSEGLISSEMAEQKILLQSRQVFFAGHIPQVTTTGHSVFAPKQHNNNLNSANRTRQALMFIFSKNMFRLGAQLL